MPVIPRSKSHEIFPFSSMFVTLITLISMNLELAEATVPNKVRRIARIAQNRILTAELDRTRKNEKGLGPWCRLGWHCD